MSQHSPGALLLVALLVGSAVGAGVTLSAVGPAPPGPAEQPSSAGADTGATGQSQAQQTGPTADLDADGPSLGTFTNESTFRTYVREGNVLADSSHLGRQVRVTDDAVEFDTARPVPEAEDAVQTGGDGGDGGSAPTRVANTNVQVGSLDEPDVVKTDGRHFYYAPENRYRGPRPLPEDVAGDSAVPRPEPAERKTHVINASDPAAPEAVAEINTTGTLLQTGETLVVFERDRVAGYDVSDPAEPTEAWSTPLNGSLVTAREADGTLYVVTASRAGPGTPCPIEPLGPESAVACEDVHRPNTQIPVDATYSAFSVEAESGEVDDSVSFVGTSHNTVVYVSPDALYVTYTKPSNRAAVTAEFLREEFDRTPDHLADRVAEIQSYDISPDSKEREIRRAFDRWVATLPDEERDSVREEFHEGISEYVGAHQRNLTQTGVVRVNASDANLSVDATGTVPGRPLNQFSMDQHNGTVRITTTIPGVGAADSENDLYVLDSNSLDEQGNVTGMGVTERVYSVRYVDDTAYVVTFRRIDPFHVVDLSDPERPEEVGELELPGFSSYLHPVDDDHVLGVGEERGKVKTVLFDVSNRSEPTIADSKVLDQGYSAVSRSHHAFLMDRKHGVFVLPAGTESLVMDYTDESLAVETTVDTEDPATRARYVDDSLYVFAGDAVTLVDETNWEETGALELDG
jgi:inhibitor of cysteine peptidase